VRRSFPPSLSFLLLDLTLSVLICRFLSFVDLYSSLALMSANASRCPRSPSETVSASRERELESEREQHRPSSSSTHCSSAIEYEPASQLDSSASQPRPRHAPLVRQRVAASSTSANLDLASLDDTAS